VTCVVYITMYTRAKLKRRRERRNNNNTSPVIRPRINRISCDDPRTVRMIDDLNACDLDTGKGGKRKSRV